MLRMAVGHSDDVDAADAIAIAVDQCRDQLNGLAPQAGFLVAAFDSFDPSLVAAVRDAFPGCALMGSTSSAEMSSTSGFLEDSVSLALFASNDIDITAGLGVGLDRDVDGACRAAIAEARSKSDRDPKVCVVFADPGIVEPQRTLDALAAALPDGVVVVGGGSAHHDLDSGAPSWQFCNERVTSEGVAVLLFSGPVAYLGRDRDRLAVTRRERGRHPLCSQTGRRDRWPPGDRIPGPYLDVTGPASFGNPLAVREVGDRSVVSARRSPGLSRHQSALSVLGSVPVGSTVQLTTATTEDILSGTRDALAEATADFPAGTRAGSRAHVLVHRPAECSSAPGRGRRSSSPAPSSGPSVALAGLYCFGEIGPISGSPSSRFLNSTFVTRPARNVTNPRPQTGA